MDWIAVLEREGHALSTAARHDFAADVPACPDWTVTDLLRHAALAYQRHRTLVAEARQDFPTEELPPIPEGTELAAFEAALQALLDTYRSADPDAEVWTRGQSRNVRFWFRRSAHETVIHRVDAEQATGAVGDIDPAIAVDGVSEYLVDLLPSTAGRRPEPGEATLHLHATDVPGEWLVRFADDGVTVEEGHAKGDAAVRGPAADLYLWVWGRRPLEGLEVFGDAAVAEKLRRMGAL